MEQRPIGTFREKSKVLDAEAMRRSLARIAYEVIEHHKGRLRSH